MMNDAEEAVEAAATYQVPPSRRHKILPTTKHTTKPPQILVNVKPAPSFPQDEEEQQQRSSSSSHFSCVHAIMIIFLLTVLMIGALSLYFFLRTDDDAKGHKVGEGEEMTKDEAFCTFPHMMGNGRCDPTIRNIQGCHNDEDDCSRNEMKEEIARVICQAIREVLGRVNCQQSVYHTHPYCEPCGKLDYSWNYLIDELHQINAHWLALAHESTTSTSTTTTTSTS